MLETGQPLHAFDLDKIDGKRIIVRRAKKGEKIISLDNNKYDLDKDILIIADNKGPLAIAGIKGGKRAEIDKKTKIIVLESANFNSRIVRKGSKKLDLKTDASWRFEHGIDPNLTEIAINRVAYLIQKIAGGKIASGLVDFYPKKVLAKKIKLDYRYLTRLLGVKIERREAKDILSRLGFSLIEEKHPILTIEVPTRRLDISIPEDLIEEIGRVYGYQKVPATFPVVSLIPPKRNFDIYWEDISKDILKELGFTEMYNYSFINEKEAKIFGYKGRGVIEVENPMSSEQKYLRPTLIPNLLKNIDNNLRYFDDIKIFELGKIFGKGEKRMLTGAATDSFYRTKGMIDSLLNKLGISNVWYDEHKPTPEQSKICLWYIGRCAEIKIDNKEIGFLGEVSPKILKQLKIDKKVVVFDIDFEELTKLCSEEHEYQPISQYPAAIRDLAVLVPIDIKVVDVLNKINIAGGALIRDIDLFDIYEGEGIPEGKKNLAFHIIYQAEDRTLKSKEIDKIHQKIIKTLEENPEWEVRR
jgi:phenylalanyl-tRNA synthetase beta chain